MPGHRYVVVAVCAAALTAFAAGASDADAPSPARFGDDHRLAELPVRIADPVGWAIGLYGGRQVSADELNARLQAPTNAQLVSEYEAASTALYETFDSGPWGGGDRGVILGGVSRRV